MKMTNSGSSNHSHKKQQQKRTLIKNPFPIEEAHKHDAVTNPHRNIEDPSKSKEIVEKHLEDIDTAEMQQLVIDKQDNQSDKAESSSQSLAGEKISIEEVMTRKTSAITNATATGALSSRPDAIQQYASSGRIETSMLKTRKTPTLPLMKPPNTPGIDLTVHSLLARQYMHIPRKKALVLIALLCMIVLPTLNMSMSQFTGAQGWAMTLENPVNTTNQNLLKTINQQIQQKPGSTTATPTPLTPQQYIDLIIHNMSIEQKLGQMMFVQCVCSDYASSLNLSTMVAQEGVGAIILSPGNNNMVSVQQLKTLTQQIQQNAQIKLAIATDQEGGEVDRLVALDGMQPSAASIGLTGNLANAQQAGTQDASNLSAYGLNLNLAPVVDVDNLNGSIMHQEGRTFGKDASTVTKMAGAYLQGLQQSGKVFGTLKHFPGLGDVIGDPHQHVTYLNRSKSTMEQIDWAPYTALIQQGLVHAIMVTHEVVPAIDNTLPASLSAKVIQGVLRDEMGFQGVIMTDSLTMEGVLAYATPGQAAALAVEAGSDLLMGASTPTDVQTMISGIQDAINSGTITTQRIDQSVRRVLMLKYTMGLLPVPHN